jgi:hypothetical protein
MLDLGILDSPESLEQAFRLGTWSQDRAGSWERNGFRALGSSSNVQAEQNNIRNLLRTTRRINIYEVQ